MADLSYQIAANTAAAAANIEALSATMQNLANNIEELGRANATASVNVNTGDSEGKLTRLLRMIGLVNGQTANVRVDVDKSLGDKINQIALLGRSLATLAVPTALAAGLPAIMGLVGVLVDLSGVAGVAVGGIAALVAVNATLKVALAGTGDAMKAIASGDAAAMTEALNKMAPAARATYQAVWDMRPAFDALRLDVQQQLFAGLSTQVQALGSTYMPVLRTGMAGVATEMGGLIGKTMEYLNGAQAVANVTAIFDNTRGSVSALNGVGASLVSIFLDVANVGSSFLPALSAGWAESARNAADFVSRARESGAMAEWMQAGLDTLRQLGEVLGNLGGAFVGVFQAASDAGGGFLANLVGITGKLNEIVNSVDGYTVLVAVFEGIAVVIHNVMLVVSALMPAFAAAAVTAGQLVTVISGALVPIAQALAPLLTVLATTVGQVLVPVIQSLVGPIVSVASAFSNALVPVLPTIVDAMVELLLACTPLIYTLQTLAPIFASLASVAAQVLIAVAPLISLFASAFQQALAILIPPLNQLIIMLGHAFVTAANALLPALMPMVDVFMSVVSALAPLLPLVGQLAILLVNSLLPVLPVVSDAFVRVVNAVVPIIPPLVQLISQLLPPLAAAFADLIVAVLPLIEPMVQIIEAILPPLIALVIDLAPIVVNLARVFSEILVAVIRDLVVPILLEAINIITTILIPTFNFLLEVVSNVFTFIGNVITTAWDVVIRPVWDAIIAAINGNLTPTFNIFRDLVDLVFGDIGRSISAAWNNVVMPVFNAMSGWVTQTLPDAFRSGVAILGQVWNTIKAALRDPVQAVIEVVYNQGIVKAWNLVAGFVGLGGLAEYHLPAYAKGGPVHGRQVAQLGEEGPEYVFSAPAVRNLGGLGAVDALHRKAAQGQLFEALQSGRLVEGADHEGPGYSTTGFGGVRPHVAKAGNFLRQKFGIASVGGVGSRPGPSDHPAGLALDFMTYQDRAKGDALADYVVANARHFLVKYIIWKQRINQGSGWKGMEDRGSVTANHFDHPHVSFLAGGAGQDFSNDGGGWSFDPIQWLRDQIGWLLDLPNKIVANNPAAKIAVGLGKKMVTGTWDFLVGKANAMISSIGSAIGAIFGGGGGDAREAVQRAATPRGWNTGPQWDALSWIVQKESSWNPTAQNPTSTAYGLFQFLDSTWGTVGGRKTSDPFQQAVYGTQYIANRYGNPVNARAFHMRNNWYANGGVVDRPTFGVLGEAGTEAVIPLTRPRRAAELMRETGLDTLSEPALHVHLTTGPQAPAERIISTALHQARLRRLAGRYAQRGR